MRGLDDRAQALLDATRSADDPSEADFDRVHAALAAKIAAGVVVGAAVTAGAKTASAGLAAGTTAGAASTAATTATAATAVTAVAGAGTATTVGAGAGGLLAAAPAVKVLAWVVAGTMTLGAGTAAVVSHGRSVEQARVASVVASTAAAPARVPVARRAANVGEARPLDVVSPPEAATPAIEPVAPVAPPRAPARVEPAAPVTVASAASLEAEVALLRDARAALHANDPAHALALLDDHAARFPSGAMAVDRDALQVFATCAAGQDEAARELAARFLARNAGSSYAAQVRAACAASRTK